MLPLDIAACKTIAVIGPNANSRVALTGNYHGTASRYITVLEGIQDLVGEKCRVLYSEGCALGRDRVEALARPGDRLAEAAVTARNSDTVILVLGLDETLEGEEGDAGNSYYSGDKEDLLLPPSQRLLLEKVLAEGKPTVVVLMAGSAIDLGVAGSAANAILLSWYPGSYGGKAVAELLFGLSSPSGKLPVTFYRNAALSEMPDFTDYSLRGRTYRYYTGTPLYPFGYGLTYGNCYVEAVSGNRKGVCVTAVNSGAVAAEDVLELYLCDEGSPLAPPNPVLCAFRRVRLAAGKRKTFEVTLDPLAFTVVTEDGERIPGSGPWSLYAGFGAPDPRTWELTGNVSFRLPIAEEP